MPQPTSITQVSPNVPAFLDYLQARLLALENLVAEKFPASGFTPGTNIDLAGNNITNVGMLSGTTTTYDANTFVTSTSGGVSGDVAVFTGSGHTIQDSGTALSSLATTSALSTYLPLTGGTMSGSIALGANALTNVGTLSGATNSRSADNIVSTTSTGISGNIPTFSAAKVIQDSGIALSSLMPKSGGTFTGGVIMSGPNLVSGGGQLTSLLKSIVYQGNTVTQTTETSLLTTATVIGSLTYAANSLSPGTTIRIRGALFFGQFGAGATVTINVKGQGQTLGTVSWTNTGGQFANLPGPFQSDIILRLTNDTISWTEIGISGQLPQMVDAGATIDPTQPLTLDITAFWSVTTNEVGIICATIETLNQA